MGSNILEVFFVSLSAMFKVALVSAVGIACSMYPKGAPLLTPEISKGLSRLSNYVLIPALVASSVGSTVSIALLHRFGILILLCMIVMGTSYVSALMLKCLHEDNSELFKATQVSVSSPNAISFPLLVMSTMCEDSIVNADFDSNSGLCFQEASSMMFIYSIGWHCVYWTFFYPVLKGLDPALRQQEGGLNFNEIVSQFLDNILLSPSLLAISIGILIGLIPNLQALLFSTPSILRPFGSALITIASPVVCTNTLIMAASLAQVYFSILESRDRSKSMQQTIPDTIISPFHVESKETYSNVEITFEQRGVPIELDNLNPQDVNITSAATHETKLSVPKWRTVAVMIICRLIIPSLVMIAVAKLFVAINLIPQKEKLMQLLLVIESSSPSAQLIIVSLNQIGTPDIASGISYMFVFQYMTSILTVTMWATIGINAIYF